MWKVPLPTFGNSIDDLVSALTYKNGNAKFELTASDKEKILVIYSIYEELKGLADNSLKGDNLAAKVKNAIYDAYLEVQVGRRLDELRSKILLSIERCPCCGILAPDEVDHHLPRSIFKPLSVYSSNLVPLCHKCNNKKRTITGEDPEQRFIHVYYNEIPQDLQILKSVVTIKEGNLVVNFTIIKPEGFCDLLHKQLTFQTERIDLNNRLNREVNIFLSSITPGLEAVYESNSDTVNIKKYFVRCANHHKTKFGLNDWRTALLIALSECSEFCEGSFIDILGIQQEG